jgi:hypothetical protein
MDTEAPSSAVIASIEGAVAWLRARAISGLRIESSTHDGERDRLAITDVNAPPLWARFYELGTNRPIFVGRDRIVRYNHNEIERERRAGYSYLGSWPAELLDQHYPRWIAQHSRVVAQAARDTRPNLSSFDKKPSSAASWHALNHRTGALPSSSDISL